VAFCISVRCQIESQQGKIVHGGSFNGNEEEGKKEETLTNRLRDVTRKGQVLEKPLRRSTF
jgi:hypothetical protein